MTLDQFLYYENQSVYIKAHSVEHCQVKTKNITTCINSTAVNIQDSSVDGGAILLHASTVDIQNCRVVDGLIFPSSSINVDIQNCQVVDGFVLTSSSINVDIWNCSVDGGTIASENVSSLDIQNCVLATWV